MVRQCAGSPSTNHYQPTAPNPFGVTLVPRYRVARNQSPGSGKRHCDPWPDPKTAVADLPRARSSPGGIFPTADASAPSPPTNSAEPTAPNHQLAND
ncbi:MAG: hypothetical protein ACHBN1_22460 [Heteroscytonema crispum UTEX LB 1556]